MYVYVGIYESINGGPAMFIMDNLLFEPLPRVETS